MFEIIKFQAWLRALGLNLIMDESELRAQSLKVEAQAFWAFEKLVHLCGGGGGGVCIVLVVVVMTSFVRVIVLGAL